MLICQKNTKIAFHFQMHNFLHKKRFITRILQTPQRHKKYSTRLYLKGVTYA